jgi:hypothetical protein
MPDFDPVRYAIPLFVLLILAELVYAQVTKKARYEARDTFASLMMGFGNMVAGVLFGGLVVGFAVWVSQFSLLDIGDSWWVWPLCFVLDDFLYYVFHRSAHRVMSTITAASITICPQHCGRHGPDLLLFHSFSACRFSSSVSRSRWFSSAAA